MLHPKAKLKIISDLISSRAVSYTISQRLVKAVRTKFNLVVGKKRIIYWLQTR